MNLLNSKKGQGRNWLAAMIFLFTFGFLTILGYLILNSYVDVFAATGYYTPEVDNVATKFLVGLRILDYTMVFVMVILIAGIGISSYKLATPPAFFIVTLVTAGIYGYISYFFNYIFAQMISDGAFTATLLYFPKTILICTNLHWFMLVMIIVGSITLYAKKERGQFLA